MGKKLNETLKFLGCNYSVKVIDYEPCIYRKISNDYDIEISGLHNKNKSFTIYVWDISKGDTLAARILEKHKADSHKELKQTLDTIVVKYSQK